MRELERGYQANPPFPTDKRPSPPKGPPSGGSNVTPKETVNHPAHYNTGQFEVIDVIEDWELNFHLGNVVKYIGRAGHKKNELEDLKKARWYLDRYIELLEKK